MSDNGRTAGLVSILISCYNHEAFVKDCLESILAQGYEKYEVIITDDASTDNSVAEIKKMEKNFEARNITFKLIVNDVNQRIVKNINNMLKESRGEYIKIIASDDILGDDYLESMVSGFEKDRSKLVLFSNGYAFDEGAHYPLEDSDLLGPLYDRCPNMSSEYVLERIFVVNTISAPAAMVRYELYEKVGLYDESFQIEDLDMWLKALEYDRTSVGVIDKKLIYYRKSANSISSHGFTKSYKNRARFMFDNELAIAKKHKKSVPRRVYLRRLYDLYHGIIIVYLKFLLQRPKAQ